MKNSRSPNRATRGASPQNNKNNINNNNNNISASSISSSCALSPLHSASLTLAILLLTALPLCTSAPLFLNPSTIEHEQLLNQIDNACSSYLSAEQPLRTSDVLLDFCGLMLGVLRKSQVSAREPSKRSTVIHPLLQLMPQLHSRRRRRVASHEDLHGPGTIQSRGYFLYRPRNGRRSTEFV